MAITLDHIVILVSPNVLANLPGWLTESFTVIDGGRHSNGTTENKLILFQDGVYIELIAFVEGTLPEDRASTRWGRRNEGEIVDFALTLLSSRSGPEEPEDTFREEIQARVRDAQTNFEYLSPAAGGRVTPEGVELLWAVSVPRHVGGALIEGELPFWCLDRTPRDLRVPFRAYRQATEHACGATGVGAVELYISEGDGVGPLRSVYESLLGTGKSLPPKTSWELEVPANISSSSSDFATTLRLQSRGQSLGEGEPTSAQLEAGDEGEQRPVCISLALFTRGESRLLSGEIGPGRVLEIRLTQV